MPCSGTWACSRAALGGVLAAQGGHRQGGACRPDALQQGADQQAASNISDAEQPQEAQSAKAAAPCARGLHIKTAEQHKKQALEAQANSAACKYEWPEDSSNWQWFTVAVTQATNSLHDMCSKTTLQILVRSSFSPKFASNAEALPGNGMKRQPSYADLASKRRAVKQPLSRLGRTLPFVGVRLPQAKPKSELQGIRLKNAQLGGAASCRSTEDYSESRRAALFPATRLRGVSRGGSLPSAWCCTAVAAERWSRGICPN